MSDVIDWLLDGAPGALRPHDVLDQLCHRLIESGFPLDRAAVFVHVLHPQYVAFSTYWRPGRPIEVLPTPYELAAEDGARWAQTYGRSTDSPRFCPPP